MSRIKEHVVYKIIEQSFINTCQIINIWIYLRGVIFREGGGGAYIRNRLSVGEHGGVHGVLYLGQGWGF